MVNLLLAFEDSMGIIMDVIHGLIAVIGLIIGRLIGDGILGTGVSSLISIILVLIGLGLAGWGLKMRGFGGAIVTGFGLGLASPITILLTGKV
jgi:hypothetical protein